MSEQQRIVRAAIYPGIGIARVGNSESEYFIGPEVDNPPPRPEGFYKDDQGALKRQAARFRIYGYDKDGNVVREITADESTSIRWRVQVANTKPAWYQFNFVMDRPFSIPSRLRNANYRGDARKKLSITPPPSTIEGIDLDGSDNQIRGEIMGIDVYLGELRTDNKGRLIFLGGHGKAGSWVQPNSAVNFGNNDGWWDDVSDGPVHAELTLDGREIPVSSAWVACTPPKPAPDVKSIVSLYDLIYDTYVNSSYGGYGFNNFLTLPAKILFTRDILPTLQKFYQQQWVNRGFATEFGWKAPHDFFQPDYFEQLHSTDEVYREVRNRVFQSFRNPDPDFFTNPNPQLDDWNGWPWLYGDNPSVDQPGLDGFLAVTGTQYRALKKWADGDFIDDWPEGQDPINFGPNSLHDVPLDKQPDMLNRASLDFLLGGPFHPGIEVTWPMRFYTLYQEPFRIRERPADVPVPDYGEFLEPSLFSGANYTVYDEYAPIFWQGPGDLTRWMGIPWHSDMANCRSGYDDEYDPYVPALWPGAVPNEVLTMEDYKIVCDPDVALSERKKAFSRRRSWFRGLSGAYLEQTNQMIYEFGRMGVIQRLPGPEDDVGQVEFPREISVETDEEFNRGVSGDGPVPAGRPLNLRGAQPAFKHRLTRK